jgi:hypothetical protein
MCCWSFWLPFSQNIIFYFLQPLFQVYVHLLDSTSVEGCLICYQKDYNLAFFKISVGQPMQLLAINHRVEYAQEVFLLGRDESLYLTIGHGRVLHCDRNLNNRHHYMNVDSTSSEVQIILCHGNIFYMISPF